jgi:hypothetical protein
MEDLYKVLLGAEEKEARGMAERLERFIKGSMTGIFDSQSNINLTSKMTVFSTKNLEEALRPIAFYMILDFVWTTIRRDLKKRILIVEEAWYLMQNPDSARFIYGIAKRARKYYLGLTTISQDVDDFLTSEYGKAIVTNSSIQMLLKQHPAAIDKVMETFYLSEGEKRFLLGAGIGEGLFFAGANHVAIKVMASDAENKLITTNPEEILRIKKEREEIQKNLSNQGSQKPVYKPYKVPESMDTYTTFDKSGAVKPEFTVKQKPTEVLKKETFPSVLKPMVKPEFKPEDKPEVKPEVKIEVKAPVQPVPQPKPQIQQNLPPKVEQKPMAVNKTVDLKRAVGDDEDYINKMPSAGDILDSVEEMRRQRPSQKPNPPTVIPQTVKPVSNQPASPIPQNTSPKNVSPASSSQQKSGDLDLR